MKKIGLIVLGIIFLLMSVFLIRYFYKNNKKSPVTYESTEAFKTDITKKTVATGAINPRKEINIKPQVSGIVEKLYVEPGQIVDKGATLAKIKLVPSQVSINEAKNSVELAKIRRNEARRESDRQQKLANQGLDIEQAKLDFENAKKEKERQEGLFKDGVISEQELQAGLVAFNLKKSVYESSKIQNENLIRQFSAELDIREQELEAAINNLQLLREGASKNSKQVSNIIRSTVKGMVLDIPIEEGSSVTERNNFNEGSTIAVIADMNELVFVGNVDESDVGKLKPGIPLELRVGAIENEIFEAKLEHIAPKGTIEEGTVKFEIKAAVDASKKDIFLRAGYSANADIILDKRQDVLALKERDVIFRNDSTFVEIEKGDQEFEEKEVKLGLSDGINIEILEGLTAETKFKLNKKKE